MRPLLLLLLLLLLPFFLASPALALVSASEQLANPVLEQQAIALGDTLRCPVCDGQSLNGSDAEIALAMRRTIRQQLQEGKTPQQVTRFLVSRYGESILLEPSSTRVVWMLPIGLICIAIVSYLLYRRQRNC